MALTPLYDGLINKSLSKITFTDHPNLNATAKHLSIEGISFSQTSPNTTILRGMMGIIQSVENYYMIEATVNLLKTSSVYGEWHDTISKACYLGEMVLYFDSYNMKELTIRESCISSMDSVSINGSTAFVPFKLIGSVSVNQDYFGDL